MLPAIQTKYATQPTLIPAKYVQPAQIAAGYANAK